MRIRIRHSSFAMIAFSNPLDRNRLEWAVQPLDGFEIFNRQNVVWLRKLRCKAGSAPARFFRST